MLNASKRWRLLGSSRDPLIARTRVTWWVGFGPSFVPAPTVEILGAVHKVRHAIFGQFRPPPLSHFVTHPGTPQKYVTHLGPPRFLVGLVQKTQTKAPCTNSLSIVRGGFCRGAFVKGSFVFKVLCGVIFVHSPFCQNTSVTTES